MQRRHSFLLTAALAAFGLALTTQAPAQAQGSGTTVTVTDELLVPEVKRFGINLGSRAWFGASAHILKNILANPGFEAGVYGMVAHVAEGSTGQHVIQDFWDTSWNNDEYGIGQPVGFWNGARYEFVYGPAKDRSGTVTAFTHENNRYAYQLDADGTVPDSLDVMFLRRDVPGASNAGSLASADTTTTRPGSPGQQSLRMVSSGNSWEGSYVSYWDSLWRDGDRTAGKLFLVQGNWRLEFWAKGNHNGAQVRARFFREGENNFIDQTLSLTTEWQLYTLDVYVPPGTDALGPYTPDEYHPLLGLALIVSTAGDEVWVDDAALYCTDDANPTAFTDAFVNRLKELRAGVLRDWSNQLGSTLDVQIAEPWARKTQGYRPHERVADSYSYSLHELLELCREVGAEPWYVIPVTFTMQEMRDLVEYLAAPADAGHPYAQRRAALGQTQPWTEVFPTIHLEYGNEAWGAASGSDPFFGASLLGGTRLGQIASDRFAELRNAPHFDTDRFNLIIGGQAGYPYRQYEIDANSSAHDTIALAPYFGVLASYSTLTEIYAPLFARPLDDVTNGRVRESYDYLADSGRGTDMAIYELNFHTTGGDAPLDIRNDFVAGEGGALALPLHMLLYLREFGVRTQTAFSSLQYSFRMNNDERVRLWGMLRDLDATGRKRPTWLGVEAVNHALQGDMVRTIQGGDNPSWTQAPINDVSEQITVNYVQSFAFREAGSCAAVLFNLHLTTALPVTVNVPASAASAPTQYRIASASLNDNNEDAETVTMETSQLPASPLGYDLTLPPHSLTVLVWPASTPTTPRRLRVKR